MKIGTTHILDTFAEAFRMQYARLIVTAHDDYWLEAALSEVTGYGSSVIGCDAEVGVETRLSPAETPDGRPGASILLFGFSSDSLSVALQNRVGQCLMTAPTTAMYDGLPNSKVRVPIGKQLRFFGDGFQKSKLLEKSRVWRIPVMDGEFTVADTVGIEKGIAGGNLIFQATSVPACLNAARRGIEAIRMLPNIIAPFPGGVVRSGSKVGSKYKGLVASTATAYCPTLRGRIHDETGGTELVAGCNAVYEIVLDGTNEHAIRHAMHAVIHALAGTDRELLAIGAGNYGGKLGKFHFKVQEIAAASF